MTFFPNLMDVANTLRTAGQKALNDTGITLNKAVPVRITTSGIALIDVSNEHQIEAIAGLTKENINSGSEGEIVNSGLIENIITSIDVGESVYISKTLGQITGGQPSVGVEGFVVGDWVVRLGVIAKNIDNPTAKDILVSIQIMGQL